MIVGAVKMRNDTKHIKIQRRDREQKRKFFLRMKQNAFLDASKVDLSLSGILPTHKHMHDINKAIKCFL